MVLYVRRLASFLAASVLMFLPHYLFQSWQWHTDNVVLPAGTLNSLLALALLGLWNTFWGVLMIRLAFDEVRDRWVGIGEAVGRLSVPIILWAIVAQFFVSVVSGLAFLLLVVPGIIVAVKFSLTVPAVVCEGLGPVAAMRLSSRMVKGHGWSVFGAFCLLLVVTLASLFGLGVFFWSARGTWGSTETFFKFWATGKSVFAQVFIGPFWAIVPTVFYAYLRPGLQEAKLTLPAPDASAAGGLEAGEEPA